MPRKKAGPKSSQTKKLARNRPNNDARNAALRRSTGSAGSSLGTRRLRASEGSLQRSHGLPALKPDKISKARFKAALGVEFEFDGIHAEAYLRALEEATKLPDQESLHDEILYAIFDAYYEQFKASKRGPTRKSGPGPGGTRLVDTKLLISSLTEMGAMYQKLVINTYGNELSIELGTLVKYAQLVEDKYGFQLPDNERDALGDRIAEICEDYLASVPQELIV